MPLITRKEAAEKMGVTIQAVYGAIKEGRLTAMQDEKGKIVINSDTLEKEWYSKSAFKRARTKIKDSNVVVHRSRLSKTDETIPEYEESKARTEHLKAELLELERKMKEKELVPMNEVENKWCDIITNARNKLLGIPAKAKQRIPDLDTNAVSCLDDIVREALEELSVA
tara:strand:- start:43 stop:549 length:507 start_codon:yes stop_codon:yes gene_type:complete